VPRGERIVFPLVSFTKAQVVDYYLRVAPFLLPHLQNRCVSLKRYPDEAGGDFFWEKDAPAFTPEWVHRHSVWRRSGESQIHFIVVDDLRTLGWCASVSTLEFHPFLALTHNINRPTSVVFDLDPGEPAGILQAAQVALRLRDLFRRLHLQSFAKVSGSKGIQVYVPLNAPVTYGDTQAFARAVAVYMANEHPKLVVSDMERAQRKGRVFVDWSQNADYKTTVCVYSLRAKRRHPYISMPVRWEDLERALADNDSASLYFLPDRALDFLQSSGDLFAPVLRLQQELPNAFESPRLQRHLHRSGSAPASTSGTAKVLHMPAASSQGGRRLFSLIKSSGTGRHLRLRLSDEDRTWQLPQGLPSRQDENREARLVSGTSRIAGDEQVGSFELVEGSLRKGYLDVFLSSEEVKGEWLLGMADGGTGSAAPTGTWNIRRPGKNDSGLRFEMPAKLAAASGMIASPPRTKKATTAENAENPENARASQKRGRQITPGIVVPWKERPPIPLDRLPAAKPAFTVPMECRLVSDPPDGAPWLYELKLDGYRAIAVKDAKADLLSRYGRSFQQRFPKVVAALKQMQLPPCVLDGEVVALDDMGRPNFQELQNSRSTRQPIVYYVFDILNYDGRDLRGLHLEHRRKLLDSLGAAFVEPVRLAAALTAGASDVVQQVKRLGLEGIVAKRRDSIYESGKRPGSWVKYRVNAREEFVIGGYRRGGPLLDAILVGRFHGDRLMFIEKVKNGFVPATRKQVFDTLQDLIIPECPFSNLPERANRRGAVDAEEMKDCVWLRPVQQCEIDFVEWTRGGHLRHAAFRDLTPRLSHTPLTPKQVV
jgi:bifunctional non-homologous end joining protein LigD